LLLRDIPSEIIEQSFKTCGISNDLNGVEGNLIWKEDSENTGERDEATIVLPEKMRNRNKSVLLNMTLIDNQVGD